MENLSKNPNRHLPNHSHAWRGSWNRPMFLDENSMHPFTVARMTDHNVRGMDPKVVKPKQTKEPSSDWSNVWPIDWEDEEEFEFEF